jgi:hypothetical protein
MSGHILYLVQLMLNLHKWQLFNYVIQHHLYQCTPVCVTYKILKHVDQSNFHTFSIIK